MFFGDFPVGTPKSCAASSCSLFLDGWKGQCWWYTPCLDKLKQLSYGWETHKVAPSDPISWGTRRPLAALAALSAPSYWDALHWQLLQVLFSIYVVAKRCRDGSKNGCCMLLSGDDLDITMVKWFRSWLMVDILDVTIILGYSGLTILGTWQ